MSKFKRYKTKGTAVSLGCLLVLAIFVTIGFLNSVKAGIPTNRQITIASSVASATDVTYGVSFITATTSNIQGLVIDFCSDFPIIGATCTAPTGFDTNESGPLALSGQSGITDWVLNAATTTNKVVLNRPSATSINSGVTISLNLGSTGGTDGITNPSAANTTYYARILTYSTTAGATGYTSTVPGTYVDAGGVALSTANSITITAKVQERLTFCVYTDAACNTPTSEGNSFNLGDTNGVLDASNAYANITSKFDISTNALSGADVFMKGNTLTSGGNVINAIGTPNATSSAGSEQFGMCLWQSTGSGITRTAPYDDDGTANCASVTTGIYAGAAQFGFDTNASDGTTSAGGDLIAEKAAGATSQVTMAFLGNISTITEAGVYQTTLTFIATGTF